MAGTFKPGDPNGVYIRQQSAGGTGGATGVQRHPFVVVSIPVPQNTVTSDGTANGGFVSWINPEVSTILVSDVAVKWNNATATGTGTFDVGKSDDGTGTVADIFDNSTMNSAGLVLVSRRGRTGTEGAGTAGMAEWFALGPGGTGVGNSIVGKTTEVTSTAKGRMIITYVTLGA